ncbi:MAG: extracellular solute-binding protein [Calditrichota bacterium]
MNQFHKITLSSFIALTLAVLLIVGCGGEGMKQGKSQYTKEKISSGALPDVPAELGGAGFTGEGWDSNENYEPTADPRGVSGGTFTYALYDFPATLRTQGKDSNTELNFLIDAMLYESLIGIHPLTLAITPGLATHWKISEDKKTFYFRINPETRWADGSRVTSEDVIASWKLRVDPGILSPYSNIMFGKYEEPVADSPYILHVTCKELNWRFFIYIGGMNLMPAKYISIPGGEYLEKYQFEMPPGSGGYEIEMLDKGKSITLFKQNDYWDKDNPKGKGASNFDRIKFIVVKDERLMFEKFKKGEFDAYQVGRAQWWKEECDFEDVRRGLVQKRKIWNDDPQGTSGLVFNMREAPFNDPRLRAAFVLLLNREKMIETLFYNEYIITDSYWPSSVYENPNNPQYRYDPDKAVKLLAEAGWKERNKDGWLVDKNGAIFELDITFASQGTERFLTVFQEDLAKVGIKLNLKPSTGPTMFKMVQEHKFKIHFQGWGGLLFPNPENSWAGWIADQLNTNNLAGVKNARIDTLLVEYNVCFDQDRRVEIIREIDGILFSIQPYALAWHAPFHRILFWNKFGYPDFYFSRTGDWRSILSYWWIDPDKAKQLEKAKKDKSITLPRGETEVLYWPKYNEEHGRKYEVKGM